MPLQVTIISIDIDDMISSPAIKIFDQEIINFGRNPACNNVVLDRPEISGKHMRIRVEKDEDNTQKIFVSDLGSLNKTTIEGEELEPNVEYELRPGQRISLGSYIVKPVLIEDNNTLTSISSPFDHNGSLSTQGSEYKSIDTRYPEDEGFQSLTSFDAESVSQEGSLVQAEVTSHRESVDFLSSSCDECSGKNPFLSYDELSCEPQADSAIQDSIIPEPTDYIPDFEPEGEITDLNNFTQLKDNDEEEIVAPEEDSEEVIRTPRIFSNIETDDDEISATEEVESVVTESTINELNFDAIQVFKISGKVLHKGKPLAGVKIEAAELGECQTNAKGVFSFDEVDEDTTYKITPSKAQFIFSGDNSEGTLQDNVHIEFTATRLFKIYGKVVDKNGNGIEDVKVNGGDLGVVNTNSNGSFEFSNIPDGTTYDISFEKENYLFLEKNLSGTLEKDNEVTVAATKMLKIEGIIRHKGTPLSDVQVDGGPLGKTTTDEKGYYCFGNVPEGTEYSITLSKEGYRFGKSK